MFSVVITSYELATSIISSNKHISISESEKCEELFNQKKSNSKKSNPKFGMVILDESHYIKSEKTKRSIAARSKFKIRHIFVKKSKFS